MLVALAHPGIPDNYDGGRAEDCGDERPLAISHQGANGREIGARFGQGTQWVRLKLSDRMWRRQVSADAYGVSA